MSDSPTLEFDDGKYDERQHALVVDIVLAIESVLSKTKLSSDEVRGLTGDIAFSICNVLDASHEMVVATEDDEELPLIPSVAFFLDESRTQLLVSQDGSFMHEYVFQEID
jgi:hypothetical protein